MENLIPFLVFLSLILPGAIVLLFLAADHIISLLRNEWMLIIASSIRNGEPSLSFSEEVDLLLFEDSFLD